MQWWKITFGTKYNGESIEVSAKYIQKKIHFGQNAYNKIYFGQNTYKKMHFGQNTMARNYIWNKIQWRKHRGFSKIHTKKKSFWSKYNGEKVHLGQNAMEKRLEVSAKYIQKNAFWAKYIYILGKTQWPKIAFGNKCNGESIEVSAKYIQKNTLWAKYNGEELHVGQNVMEKA